MTGLQEVNHNTLNTKNARINVMRCSANIIAYSPKKKNYSPGHNLKYDKEVVSGGKPGNTFDEYLAAKEKKRIDERLAELKSMVDDYNHLLEIKRNQLEKSENIKDKIYYYRIVKRWSIELVCKKVGYREAQLHRYLKDINEELKQR